MYYFLCVVSYDEKAMDLEEMLQELQQNSTHIVRLQDGRWYKAQTTDKPQRTV